MSTEVCRLCMGTDDLVWIFDKRIICPENMKEIIFITTGVEVLYEDVVSQKVCSKCCKITIKMYQFRSNALKNDLELKKKSLKLSTMENMNLINAQVKLPPKPTTSFQKQPTKNLHPSVKQIFTKFPCVKLPTSCLASHLSPMIVLKKTDVKEYVSDLTTQPAKKICLDPTRTSFCIEVNDKTPTNIETIDALKRKLFEDHDLPEVSNIVSPPSFSAELMIQKETVRRIEEQPVTPQMSVIQSVGLTPKNPDQQVVPDEPQPLLSYIEKSVTIHICDICNTITYNLKELTTHKRKHLRCQFCKTHFRTFQQKTDHIAKDCYIKNMMLNLPNIRITKVEFETELREKYPMAFEQYFLSLQKKQNISNTSPTHVYSTESTTDMEVLCISDDDYEDDDRTTLKDVDIPEISAIPSSCTPPPTPNVTTQASNEQSESYLKYPTVSIVKPIINIPTNDVLNQIDAAGSDVSVIKHLLSMHNLLHTQKDANVQTELPNVEAISINTTEKVCEFKHLKQQLIVYKVPVEIKKGSFKVSYIYNRSQNKPRKKLCYWFHLGAVDVVTERTPQLQKTKQQNLSKPNGAAPMLISSSSISSEPPLTCSSKSNPTPMLKQSSVPTKSNNSSATSTSSKTQILKVVSVTSNSNSGTTSSSSNVTTSVHFNIPQVQCNTQLLPPNRFICNNAPNITNTILNSPSHHVMAQAQNSVSCMPSLIRTSPTILNATAMPTYTLLNNNLISSNTILNSMLNVPRTLQRESNVFAYTTTNVNDNAAVVSGTVMTPSKNVTAVNPRPILPSTNIDTVNVVQPVTTVASSGIRVKSVWELT